MATNSVPTPISGGYDDGYRSCPCFWGRVPGSIVQRLFDLLPQGQPVTVLDAGCGEGKNAAAFAERGHEVMALDCSAPAIANGRRAFPHKGITWENADIASFLQQDAKYDVVLAYGLLHCLPDRSAIVQVMSSLMSATKRGGYFVLCSMNDRSQDLSAHPGFSPTLLPHDFYTGKLAEWLIVEASDRDLYETHPHNDIPHSHSLTRILARKP